MCQYLYAYDPNGNRLTQQHDGTLTSYTIGDNNELTAVGSTNLTYDQFGNTLTYGLLNFTWDSEGHMLTGTDTSAFPNKVDTHEVDGDGRRMRAKWANAADWTNFVYDELESGYPAILAEYTLISGAFTIKSLNTHGLGVINTNREGTKRYFHFDGLGSTWALTDASEVVQDTYTWSAFGVQEAATGSSVNPFRYVGQFGSYADSSRGSTMAYYTTPNGQYLPTVGLCIAGFNAGNGPLNSAPVPACPAGYDQVANCTEYYDLEGKLSNCGPVTGDPLCMLTCSGFDGQTIRDKGKGNCDAKCWSKGLLKGVCLSDLNYIDKRYRFAAGGCDCDCRLRGHVYSSLCACCKKRKKPKPIPLPSHKMESAI